MKFFKILLILHYRLAIISNTLQIPPKLYLTSNLVVENLITLFFSACNTFWNDGWPQKLQWKWLTRPKRSLNYISPWILMSSTDPDGNTLRLYWKESCRYALKQSRKEVEYLSKMCCLQLKIRILQCHGLQIMWKLCLFSVGILWLCAPIHTNRKEYFKDLLKNLVMICQC